MSDEEIRNHIRDAFIQEPAFANCAIRGPRTGWKPSTTRRRSAATSGSLSVGGWRCRRAGTKGSCCSKARPPASHKRLAGALAWWVPGSRDVLNCLEVVPPEDDNNDEITDAVKIVLDRDPFVDDVQVLVSTRDRVVTLEGAVRSEGEKDMAEFDAWFVFGVDRVINNLQVV